MCRYVRVEVVEESGGTCKRLWRNDKSLVGERKNLVFKLFHVDGARTTCRSSVSAASNP